MITLGLAVWARCNCMKAYVISECVYRCKSACVIVYVCLKGKNGYVEKAFSFICCNVNTHCTNVSHKNFVLFVETHTNEKQKTKKIIKKN